ncbi:MAG: Lrp/AsnC family transcriptional regulator [Betaproteobacteria bacterium]|nr:Lrp/AsnC family transcriptional regulator [Betaproteobacteria bacterium]
MDDFEFRLLNEFQHAFPLHSQPFRTIAGRLGVDVAAVLGAYARLGARGALSRIGAVFGPNRVGASTLAAMRVPEERLHEVARRVSARPEVNHNYEREHEWNLWFVATAQDAAALAAALGAVERECGLPVMALPLIEDYHIDLGFDLRDGRARVRGARNGGGGPRVLTGAQRALVAALQRGLPLVARPYAELGARAGMTEAEVVALIERWAADGTIKRFGVVVRHHELGYGANAMVVWDVPDEEVTAVGHRVAGADAVTLCYRRPRRLPEWRYNLFCMIHGRDRAQVAGEIEALRARCGLERYPYAVLFSRRRFKQRGARYVTGMAESWIPSTAPS